MPKCIKDLQDPKYRLLCDTDLFGWGQIVGRPGDFTQYVMLGYRSVLVWDDGGVVKEIWAFKGIVPDLNKPVELIHRHRA